MSNRIYSVNPLHPEMVDIAENPANVPPPIDRTEPTTVEVNLETIEVEAHLNSNSIYRFWTFNGTVPGPMLRVRVIALEKLLIAVLAEGADRQR